MHEDQYVGTLFRDGKMSWAPGSYFTMRGGECSLNIFWDNITAEDVWRVANGKVSFAVWYSDDRDLYFLYRFEGCHWSDTVFSTMQLPEVERVRPPFMRPGERLHVCITLVECETGLIQARRQLSFSHPLSKKLCLAVDKHFYSNYTKNWTPSAFEARVNRIYQTYPEPEMLIKAQGCILCTGQEAIDDPAAEQAAASADEKNS